MSGTILAVDDSRIMRELVACTLCAAGFDVISAEDGQDALRLLDGIVPDVIMTDLNMPNMDGFALIKALRAYEASRATPILMMTTDDTQDNRKYAEALGVTGWISKPFHPGTLIENTLRFCA